MCEKCFIVFKGENNCKLYTKLMFSMKIIMHKIKFWKDLTIYIYELNFAQTINMDS